MSDSTPTPPAQIGLIAKAWRALFGAPKPLAPIEVWKTVKQEYLRSEDRYSADPSWPIDTFAIYALHQVSLTTGNQRIVEDWRLS